MAVEGENMALHELLAVARQQAPSAALPESSTAAEAIAAIVASGDHSRFSAEEAARLCAAGAQRGRGGRGGEAHGPRDPASSGLRTTDRLTEPM